VTLSFPKILGEWECLNLLTLIILPSGMPLGLTFLSSDPFDFSNFARMCGADSGASNLSAQSIDGRGHPAPAEGIYREVLREANRHKSAEGSELDGQQLLDNNPPTSKLDLVVCV
jgi:hypothetical protein